MKKKDIAGTGRMVKKTMTSEYLLLYYIWLYYYILCVIIYIINKFTKNIYFRFKKSLIVVIWMEKCDPELNPEVCFCSGISICLHSHTWIAIVIIVRLNVGCTSFHLWKTSYFSKITLRNPKFWGPNGLYPNSSDVMLLSKVHIIYGQYSKLNISVERVLYFCTLI